MFSRHAEASVDVHSGAGLGSAEQIGSPDGSVTQYGFVAFVPGHETCCHVMWPNAPSPPVEAQYSMVLPFAHLDWFWEHSLQPDWNAAIEMMASAARVTRIGMNEMYRGRSLRANGASRR
jgi:hypothetical protein